MKALVYNCKDRSLMLKEKPIPKCGEEDIILKVKATGICGGDLHFYGGQFDSPVQETEEFIIGHEFAGEIVECGKKANKKWKIGDRVVTDNTGYACGECESCAKGHFCNCVHRIPLGLGIDGGFSEYVKVPGNVLKMNANSVFLIPENISYEEATVLEPAANAYRIIIQEGQVKPGEDVVIYGPGPIGLLCVQIAKIAGARNIVLIGQKKARNTRATIGMKYGATHWLENDGEQNIEQEILKICGAKGADIVVDAVGHPSILKQAINVAKTEGTIIRAGLNETPLSYDINLLSLKAVKIQGHMGYDTECWVNCIRLAEKGKLDLGTIITHKLSLDDWEKGWEMSINNSAGKVVLIP